MTTTSSRMRMARDHNHDRGQSGNGSGWKTRKWVFVGFLVVAGYFLIMEHRAHLEGALVYLPYLLLLACPLMHLFHHGQHSHGGRDGAASGDTAREKE